MLKLSVAQRFLEIKFDDTLQTSSITTDSFKLYRLEGDEEPTEAEIENPFKPINIAEHYNSLARVLYIYFSNGIQLTTGDTYRLDVSVRNASGKALNYKADFVWSHDSTEGGDGPAYLDDSVIKIEDYSIKRDAFISSETINAANPDFHITTTDPRNGDIFLEPDYNRGRVSVTFSERPMLAYINSQYIKVQKKKISTSITRWETIDNVLLSLDSVRPRLYISFPSLGGEEPVYDAMGESYFEDGHKYRIRMSREIAAA